MTWSADCVIIYKDVAEHVPTCSNKSLCSRVILSTQDHAKVLTQLKSGFKRTKSWNRYLTTPELLAQNANLNNSIDSSCQGVNKLFVLAFENDAKRISNKRYYISNVKVKDYNVMIDGKNVLNQPVKMIK